MWTWKMPQKNKYNLNKSPYVKKTTKKKTYNEKNIMSSKHPTSSSLQNPDEFT